MFTQYYNYSFRKQAIWRKATLARKTGISEINRRLTQIIGAETRSPNTLRGWQTPRASLTQKLIDNQNQGNNAQAEQVKVVFKLEVKTQFEWIYPKDRDMAAGWPSLSPHNPWPYSSGNLNSVERLDRLEKLVEAIPLEERLRTCKKLISILR